MILLWKRQDYLDMKSKHYKMISLEEVLKDWEMQLVWDMSFEDGELAKARKIAKGMLTKNFDLNIIAELTGLTEDEIKKL